MSILFFTFFSVSIYLWGCAREQNHLHIVFNRLSTQSTVKPTTYVEKDLFAVASKRTEELTVGNMSLSYTSSTSNTVFGIRREHASPTWLPPLKADHFSLMSNTRTFSASFLWKRTPVVCYWCTVSNPITKAHHRIFILSLPGERFPRIERTRFVCVRRTSAQCNLFLSNRQRGLFGLARAIAECSSPSGRLSWVSERRRFRDAPPPRHRCTTHDCFLFDKMKCGPGRPTLIARNRPSPIVVVPSRPFSYRRVRSCLHVRCFVPRMQHTRTVGRAGTHNHRTFVRHDVMRVVTRPPPVRNIFVQPAAATVCGLTKFTTSVGTRWFATTIFPSPRPRSSEGPLVFPIQMCVVWGGIIRFDAARPEHDVFSPLL